jgi:hypothetical protein
VAILSVIPLATPLAVALVVQTNPDLARTARGFCLSTRSRI